MAYLEILAAIVLGVLSGIITGLIPGIHVNLISIIALSLSPFLLTFTSPLNIAIYIIGLAITHTFVDSIPSIYLGAPDAGQELNILPGHRLLHKGQGHNAILCTIIGSLGCLLLGIILFPLFVKSMAKIYPIVKNMIGFILIAIMMFMIFKDKGKRVKNLATFMLAGVLGLTVLNIPNLNQPLFPLLSGLFGFSIIILSLQQKSVIPKQNLHEPLVMSKKNLTKALTAASSVGFIAAFLPGFGNSQAAIVATQVVKDIGDEAFLALVGGINTINMLISIGTIYILDKARNGAIVTVDKLLEISLQEVLIFLGVALAVGGLAAIFSTYLSKIFARIVTKMDYPTIVWNIIIFIAILTFYFDGLLGLVVLTTATSIGLLVSSWNVGKNHLMGCLILPVILFFVL